MKEGHDQAAVSKFAKHITMLNAKKSEFQNDDKIIQLIEDNLKLSKSYLTELSHQASMENEDRHFTPITEKEGALDSELELYDPRAQGLLKRMVTYPLPHYTYQDVIGMMDLRLGLLTFSANRYAGT